MSDLAIRFWRKVVRGGADECWPWTGAATPRGYGQVRTGGKCHIATHVAVFLTTSEWPGAGLCVCHRCDNPRCVNPAHLFVGTQRQNLDDMVAKGRQRRADPKTVAWCVGSNNPGSVLNEESAAEAIRLLNSGVSQYRVAAAVGVSRSAIQAIANGRTWKQVRRSVENV